MSDLIALLVITLSVTLLGLALTVINSDRGPNSIVLNAGLIVMVSAGLVSIGLIVALAFGILISAITGVYG